jgi:hypothetical protein
MRRCKTCRHWEPPENALGEVSGVGECKAVVLYSDATEWRTSSGTRQLKPEYSSKLAFVQDVSDYTASLYTMPEFGCVQHEGAQ